MCTSNNISTSQHFLSKQINNSSLQQCQRQPRTCDFPRSQLQEQIQPQHLSSLKSHEVQSGYCSSVNLFKINLMRAVLPHWVQNWPSLPVQVELTVLVYTRGFSSLFLRKANRFRGWFCTLGQRIQERPQIPFDSGVMFFYDFSANFSHALSHLWDIIQYSY